MTLLFDRVVEIRIEHNVQTEYVGEESVYREKHQHSAECGLQASLCFEQVVIHSNDAFEMCAAMHSPLSLHFPRFRCGVVSLEQRLQQFMHPLETDQQVRDTVFHVANDKCVDDLFADFA